ncbi:MAG: hypothetical protein M3214_06790 [Actinomycetota bacterium]|nr:hypothetical protein [Actinomycetota bacterium]
MPRRGHDAAFSRQRQGVKGMSARFEGPDNGLEPRDWLLECEGWRVEDEDGRLIGHVLTPVYEPSARWDRPRALAVRTAAAVVEVPLSQIASVDPDDSRIAIDDRRY